MLHLKKILVPTDQAPSALRAFRFAGDLAERCDAEVHVLHVLPLGSREPLYAFFEQLFNSQDAAEEAREKLLRHVEQAIRAQVGEHPRIRRIDREGAHVAQEILAYTREEAVDLIAMGTHGHRSLEHALGGTAGEVVRRAPCPVLIARGRDDLAAPDEELAVRHLLVPIDFSEHAAEAVRVARELGACYHASVSLLFVAEERTVPVFSDTGLFSITTLSLDADIVDHADEALNQLYEHTAGPAVPATCHVRRGHPAREILEFADTYGVDLIVMSTHGQTAIESFTLGSVTEKVARRAPCPVLILKAFGKAPVFSA